MALTLVNAIFYWKGGEVMGNNDSVFTVTLKTIADVSDVKHNIEALQNSFKKLKLPDKIGDNLQKNISNFMKEYDKYQSKVAQGIHTQGDQNAVNKSLNSMLNSYSKIIDEFDKLSDKDFKEIFNLDEGAFKKVQSTIKQMQAEIKKVKLDPKQLTEPIEQISKLTKANAVFGSGKGFDKIKLGFEENDIEKAKEGLADIDKYLERFRSQMSDDKYKGIQEALDPIREHVAQAERETQKFTGTLDRAEKELQDLGVAGTRGLKNTADALKKSGQAAEKLTETLKRQYEEEFSFNRQAQDIDRQIQSYFGLSQMIRKVGDIAKNAFQTVKELDAAMTETAVVTNFSVGDMWEMLPTYTKQANQLGSTIKDVYEAATLYYQQGLNTNQAMGLANETLKMARIAGLDAADATNMMTAALRGFNMEINQASAQKINDIYSELAAITASDTKEIGSAMERTASIANSANMDFATTSAFLAQMIETTREAPENLGTAMKTIVARFQEMKQDPTKLVDSEGVAMDANKVDAALKTIGVNLTNTRGEFRNLDEVFLDISARWDSLTQGQQRYIATIAAGSRQQSRFIAMMSDYDRTMELVDAANNSAGASQKQFEKTLDSMSTKLNQLKNAWDQFVMGLANNQIIKFSVDALTEGFTIINKFIDLLGKIPPSPFEGITKSALTLVTTLSMLNLGKKASRGLVMGGIGWWKGEESFTQGFGKGFRQSGASGFLSNRNKQEAKDTNTIYQQQINKRLSSSAKEQFIRTPIVADTYLKRIDTSNLDERIKAAIEDELDQPITEDVKVKINRIIDQDANGSEELHIKDEDLIPDTEKIGQFESKIGSLAGKLANAGELMQQFGDKIGGPVGSALSTVGATLITVGSALDATAASFMLNFRAALMDAAGMEADTVATTGAIAAKAGFIGTVKALGVALWSSLGPLLAIAAAVAAIVAVVKLADAAYESNAEKMERMTDAAAKASEAFDSAKQETSELADAISQIKTNDEAFDGLVAGTAEFNEKLIEANQKITELINKYPMLADAKFLTTDSNGLMHINEEGYKAVQEEQKRRQNNAAALTTIQNAQLTREENRQKADKLETKVVPFETEEEAKKRKEEAKYLRESADAAEKVAQQSAITTILSTKELKYQDEIAAIRAEQYDSLVDQVDTTKMGIDDMRQAYADFYGYTYDKASKEIKDVEGNVVLTKDDDAVVKDAIPDITVQTNLALNAESLDSMLGTINNKFSEVMGDNSKTLFSDVMNSSIETNEDVLKDILQEPDKIADAINSLSDKELAALMSVSEEDVTQNREILANQLKNDFLEKANNIAELQSKSYADLAAMMAQTQFDTIEKASTNKSQKRVAKQIENLTSEQAQMMSKIGLQLEAGAGTDTMKSYIGFMSDLYKEVNHTKFGNIDLNNREIQKNIDGTISTVLGSSGNFGKSTKRWKNGIPIAFSPLLQTGTGKPIELKEDTLNEYINAVLEKAGGTEKATKEKILEIDANPEKFGLDVKKFEVDGHQIKGLIADVGKTAIETGEKMHQVEVDKKATKEIEEILGGANLETATGRLETYNKLLNSSIDTVHDLGEELRYSADESDLLGKAFNDDFLGGDWTELQENIDDFQNSFGKIDGAGILKAAEQSKSLKTLLDSGEVSASALAAALQGIEDGQYSIGAVNGTILKLLTSMNGLADAAMEAHNIIQNFDAGIDTGEGDDFVAENAKAAKEYYENGELGNEQLQNYIKLAAGTDRWNATFLKFHGNLQKTEDELMKYVTTFEDGFQPAWDQMISGKGINGKSLSDNIKAAVKDGRIDETLGEAFDNVKVRWDENDLMQIDVGDLTTSELEIYFQEIYGVSEEYSKLLMQDLANYDATLASRLQANDLQGLIESGELQRQRGTDNLILTDEEINILKATGTDLKEVAKAASTTVQELKKNHFDVLTKDGERKSAEGGGLLRSYAKLFQTDKRTIKSLFGLEEFTTDNTFDLQKLITDIQAKGMDEEQSMRSAYEAWVAAQKEGQETSYNGQELDLKKDASYEEFTEAITTLTEQSQWVTVGDTIGERIVSAFTAAGLVPEGATETTPRTNTGTPAETGTGTTPGQSRKTPSGRPDDRPMDFTNEGKKDREQAKKTYYNGLLHAKENPDPRLKPAGAKVAKNAQKEVAGGVESGANKANSDSQGKGKKAVEKKTKDIIEKTTDGGTVAGAKAAAPKQKKTKTSPNAPQNQPQEKTVTITSEVKNEEAIDNLNKKLKKIPEEKKSTITVTQKYKTEGKKVKAKDQKANVSYDLGKQANPDDKKAKVNYTLGKQAAPKPKETTVDYNMGTQADPKSRSITLWATIKDKKSGKTISAAKLSDSGATGINNKIPYSSSPQFGSLAAGTHYGRVGPKGKGGLTLTGEKGFEIAWLPSESRSMILGADGPQMLNLPSDAVVYTHEQSKKIIKQKSIPAGSHNRKRQGSSTPASSGGGGGNSTGKGDGGGNGDKNSKDTKKAVKTFTRWVTKAGQVSVWWENIARVMDDAQRDAEKTQNKLKKLLDTFGATLDNYKEVQNTYVEQQKRVIATAERELEKVGKEIDTIANGTTRQQKARAGLDEAKAQQREAKKTQTKKDDKEAAKAVKKANKEVKAANKAANKKETGSAVQISWEIKQQKKKGKKGKWKSTKKKKTKKQIVDLSKFIYEDENGVLQIDQAELDKIAGSRKKGGKAKAEAIKDAAEKEINDRISKQNAAEDAAEKAQEAIIQDYNDAYKAFNQWNKSITKLYLLGLEVEKLGNLRSAFESVTDLEFAKLEAGFSSVIESVPKIQEAFKKNIDILVSTAQLNTEKAVAAREELDAILDPSTHIESYMKFAGSSDALADFESMRKALEILGNEGAFTNGRFDYNKASASLEKLYKEEYNAESYNKIKEAIDKLAEKQNEVTNAVAEANQSRTELYTLLEDYQSQMADFEDSLISGIEEQANKEIDRLNKLNSSLTNAAKDLIDEVKRKLDERRKQEDNAKTENDISRKQQRLAMLRADTAGGHAVEIAQLEKEIADSQQSYQRSLEDQLLDKLQKQNDEAAKQRERQIELLEAQRDLAEALGTNVAEVNEWLKDPERYEEQIKAAWMANKNFEESGLFTQQQISEEWEKTWANIRALMGQEGAIYKLTEILSGDTLSDSYTTGAKDISDSLSSMDKTLTDILNKLDSGLEFKTSDDFTIQDYKNHGYNAAKVREIYSLLGKELSAKDILEHYSLEEVLNSGAFNIGELTKQGYSLETVLKKLLLDEKVPLENIYKIIETFDSTNSSAARKMLAKMKFLAPYATGGLATHTGPAWLDGTPTKPELVLNAQDTKNFIALKDVLSHAINSTGSTSQENAVYDIDINVDHINSDYDVDKIAKRVQNIIVEKSSYRNVTQVRSFR